MLCPGALAFVEYERSAPVVEALTLESINAHRSYQSNPLQTRLISNPIVKVTLVPGDVKRMSWAQYSAALGYPLVLAMISTFLHLSFWHLLQILLFLLSFLSFYDIIDRQQLWSLSALMIRELVYAFNLCIGAYFKGAYLLYHPLAACRASRRQLKLAILEICAYAFQPDKWVLKMAFVDKMRKPCIYYTLITSTAILDSCGIAALIVGIQSGILPKPLLLCYILAIVSLVYFVLTVIFTDFFQEVATSIDADFIVPLKDAGFTVRQLREAGAPVLELHKAGFTFEELIDAAVSLEDLRLAGFSAKELRLAGFSAKDLGTAGYSGRAFFDASVSLEDLRLAGFSVKELLREAWSQLGATWPEVGPPRPAKLAQLGPKLGPRWHHVAPRTPPK